LRRGWRAPADRPPSAHPHEAPELALGTRYTLDTVRALRRAYPKARFIWLMAADILPNWSTGRTARAVRRHSIAAFAPSGLELPGARRRQPRAPSPVIG